MPFTADLEFTYGVSGTIFWYCLSKVVRSVTAQIVESPLPLQEWAQGEPTTGPLPV